MKKRVLEDTFDTMEMIVNSTGALVYVIDLESYELLFINDRCREVFGNVEGKKCYQELQKDQIIPCTFCPIHQTDNPLLHPIGANFEWENCNSLNGRHYLFNDRIIQWKNGRKAKIQIGIDITDQKRLEHELADEREEAIRSFEALIDATIEGLIIFDEDKRCMRVNQVAPLLLGYTDEEMLGRYALEFIAPDSKDYVRNVIQNNDQEPYEASMHRKDGSVFPALLRGRDIVLAGKSIRVSAVMDITHIKAKEAQILQLAHFDSLTNLPNRLHFCEKLDDAIKKSKRSGYYGALLFIDLDHFKAVNDSKGHMLGDMVLVEAAKRISAVIRESDILARLGGDEFVVLVDTFETDKKRASADIAIIANKLLYELQKPYLIDNSDFRLTGSAGIALFLGEEYTLGDLMKYADSAMYCAKDSGRNTFSFFDPILQTIVEEKIYMIERLRMAIERQSMELHYQNQVQVDEHNMVVGVEALIRWNDLERGMISPGHFIPIAEESGLIVPLGEWILREAMKQIQSWECDPIKNNWRVSVNVSYKQFEKETFVAMVEAFIEEFDINPNKLRLEITEGLVIKNTKEALEKLHRLKEIGLTISIDDFGTGYSSLSYLKKLPIDELKIDQSFIRDLVEDPNDRIIVQTIISIGQQFGLDVIAEGVETHEQYEQLKVMGCKYFQGYFFGKPVDSLSL